MGHPIAKSHLRRSEAGERGLDAPSWASQSTAGRPTHQGAWTLSHAQLNMTKPISPSQSLAFSRIWWDLQQLSLQRKFNKNKWSDRQLAEDFSISVYRCAYLGHLDKIGHDHWPVSSKIWTLDSRVTKYQIFTLSFHAKALQIQQFEFCFSLPIEI